MVVSRTEVLTVRGIKRVTISHLAPAAEVFHRPRLTLVAVEEDVKQTGILQLQWHVVVHLVDGQPHIQPHRHLVSRVQHGNGRILLFLLHWEQQVSLASLR